MCVTFLLPLGIKGLNFLHIKNIYFAILFSLEMKYYFLCQETE